MDRQPMIPTIPPLAFLDTAGQEKQHGKSQSFFNKGEIDMAVQLVRRLLLGGVEAESIGVIALYKTQADMLQEQLCGQLGQRNRVQVSTVDAYQGSEREIIIISCVRTEKIGFIANPNRVNVALSRARRHCLVLGARKLLETNSMWRRILEYCRQDDNGDGVVSAQSFLNRLASAVANNTMAGDDFNIGSPAIDLDLGFGNDLCHSPADVTESERDQQTTSADMIATVLTDDEGNESVVADECEYGDEGVVGGSLSQWSMPGICIDSDDGDEDVLDCLDVDADDM
ncbi:hypothetical protein GGI24_002306 [Coemansia furcata]|nr:hypothetical protein GGI24_002306 [Coemansia furcata]